MNSRKLVLYFIAVISMITLLVTAPAVAAGLNPDLMGEDEPAVLLVLVPDGTVSAEGTDPDMSGSFPVGTQITITADAPPPGQAFDHWEWEYNGTPMQALPGVTDNSVSPFSFTIEEAGLLQFSAFYREETETLETPDPPMLSSASIEGGLSITVNAVPNAFSYLARFYQGTSFVYQCAVLPDMPFHLPLSPGVIDSGVPYIATVTAVGDGGLYLNSAESAPSTPAIAVKPALPAASFTYEPHRAVYSGATQTVSAVCTAEGAGAFEIRYQNQDGSFDAPHSAGIYGVYLNVEEGRDYAGAQDLYLGDFIIDRRTPELADFSLSATSVPYTGSGQPFTVIPWPWIDGACSVLYSGALEVPTAAGVYAVTLEVAESSNCCAATFLLPDYHILPAQAGTVSPPPPLMVDGATGETRQVALSDLLPVTGLEAPMLTGPVAYTLLDVSDSGGILAGIPTLSGDMLTLSVSGGNTPGTQAALTLEVSASNVVPTPSWVRLTVETTGKLTPSGTVSAPEPLTYGDTLKTLSLQGAESFLAGGVPVPGTLAWQAPTTVPAVGSSAGWIFTPDDRDRYAERTGVLPLTVLPRPVSETELSPLPDCVYTGESHESRPDVRFRNRALILNQDYLLSYSHHRDAGTAAVTVSGIGNYTGTLTGYFVIHPAPLDGAVVIFAEVDRILPGALLSAQVTGTPPDAVLSYQWYQDGVPIPSADAAGFTVPDGMTGAITLSVTASGNYTGTLTSPPLTVDKETPPDHGGGGGESSSGGADPGGTETARPAVTIQPTVRGGAATALVDETALLDALARAETTSPPTLELILPGDTFTSASVTLPAGAVKVISNREVALRFSCHLGALTLDPASLSAVALQSEEPITLSLGRADLEGTLSPRQQDAVGPDPVFDVSVSVGSARLTSLDGGTASVTLSYPLPDREPAGAVGVWQVGSSGTLRRLPSAYDSDRGEISFSTSHLSRYLAACDPLYGWYNPYTDVTPADPSYSAVRYLTANGLYDAEESQFQPQAPMTRAMLVTALWRLAGSPEIQGSPFTDVPASARYAQAAAWAGKVGVTMGVGGGRFAPEAPVTWEQIAVMLSRWALTSGTDLAKLGVSTPPPGLPKISPWAVDGMRWATGLRLLPEQGERLPYAPAARGESAAVLQCFLLRIQGSPCL